MTPYRKSWLVVLTAAALFACGGSAWAVNWDEALINGTTPYGKIFYAPGEEMVFTLKLEGLKEELPANTFFVDWERRGDDGLTEKGRAPLPFPAEGLVLKTKSEKPGFVCIEANVVTADGKRVPKNHRWEKRVFFEGGAGVQPELIPMADEPKDYDEFWAACLKELEAVPMNAEMKPVECPDKEVRLYAVRIPCAGPWPVTGYLTIPVKASKTNRMPITATYRGACQTDQLPPKNGPHNRISMQINANGFELGRGPEYIKEFFKGISEKGYGYGMGPKSNESRDTSYWKWCALRAIRYLQWIKTLPEWDGKELVVGGGSQGDWQALHGAAHVPGVTRISANGSWGGDWTGQAQFKRQRSIYRPDCWYPDMAYFDPVFAAKRISCPVNIAYSGLGDYVSTPASLTLIYRNLKGPKKITYVQGSTHGWRPDGVQKLTIDGGYDAAVSSDPLVEVRAAIARGEKSIKVPKGKYYLTPAADAKTYLELSGLTGVTIDFSGAELVGAVKTAMIFMSGCTNVTLKNVVIDYSSLPFTQAVIEKADKDGNWDVRVIPGYPCPNEAELKRDADFWPLQVYDAKTLELKNPMRFQDGVAIARTGPDTYRVTGGKNRKGDVGDIAVWSVKEVVRPIRRAAVTSDSCKGCTFENVVVYSTPHGCGFWETSADGNRYVGCALMRRPPETDLFPRGLKRLRSGNHDAFNSRESYKGPTLEKCTFQYHCDDCVNISGRYAFVTAQKGRKLRVVPYVGKIMIEPGDTCELTTFEGKCLPDAKVVSVRDMGESKPAERKLLESYKLWPGIAQSATRAFVVELDSDRELPQGSAIISNRRMGNGFTIRNCTMGHNRARGLLIKASDGLIEGNVIEGSDGHAIQIAPEYSWMEGGCGKNVVVRDNVMRGNGGGIHVAGQTGARKPMPVDSHRNITITGNRISGSAPGISVVGCTGLDVRGNKVELPAGAKAGAFALSNVADVQKD